MARNAAPKAGKQKKVQKNTHVAKAKSTGQAAAGQTAAERAAAERDRAAAAALRNHTDTAERALRDGIKALSVAVTTPVCREAESAQVQSFITGAEVDHPMLQMFGLPGTGKTAVVKSVLDTLEKQHRFGGRRTTSLFLNGYLMQNSMEVFSRLYEHLAETRLGRADRLQPQHAAVELERRFATTGWASSGPAKKKLKKDSGAAGGGGGTVPVCVLIIDEMDRCAERTNAVLYRLADMLLQPHAHCRMICIANAMVLPERLDSRVRSRMATPTRITFPAYSKQQLEAILMSRVGRISPPLFTAKAVGYLSSQIADEHGDARRLLQCAAEIVHERLSDAPEAFAKFLAKYLKDRRDEGLLAVSDCIDVANRMLRNKTRDFVAGVADPISLGAVAVVTMLTKRREDARLDDGKAGVPLLLVLESLATVMQRHAHAHGFVPHQAVAAPRWTNKLSVTRSLWPWVEVGLLECETEDGDPLRDESDLADSVGARVSLMQPYETMATAFDAHPTYQALLHAILNTS